MSSRHIIIAGAEVRRADDFQTTGNYIVWFRDGIIGLIYRDPESREWYDADAAHYSQGWLGSSKKEAVERLVGRQR